MRAVVVAHSEAASKVAVFLDACVDLRFKNPLVSRPGHKFVVDRVAQVEHACLSRRNTLKHRIVVHILYEERGKGSQTNDKETGAANDSHLSPQFNLRQTDCAPAIRATESPALRRSRPCAEFPDTPDLSPAKRSPSHSSPISFPSPHNSPPSPPGPPAGAAFQSSAGPLPCSSL